jgi:hypothetical protein
VVQKITIKILLVLSIWGTMQPIWLVERTVNWQHILNLRVLLREFDTEIELYFKYSMPPELRAKFSKTEVVMSMKNTNSSSTKFTLQEVLDRSLEQHAAMCEQFRYVAGSQSIRKIVEDDIDVASSAILNV